MFYEGIEMKYSHITRREMMAGYGRHADAAGDRGKLPL
jgi:hypothetical protein